MDAINSRDKNEARKSSQTLAGLVRDSFHKILPLYVYALMTYIYIRMKNIEILGIVIFKSFFFFKSTRREKIYLFI